MIEAPKSIRDLAGHEIRFRAERGDEVCIAELKRRKGNMKNAFVPSWEQRGDD